MDYMSNKALIIAVSLIVTMTIASAVLFTINQVKGIYKTVYETDTLIQSNFDEFDAYDGAVKTKLDLLNTLKKYKDKTNIYVTYKKKDDLGTNNATKINTAKNAQYNLSYIENELVEGVDESGKIIIKNTQEASKEYNTYIERLDNDGVIIGFVPK